MKNRIIEELHNIEKQHQVRILLAVEVGSRATNLASHNSDYDVRFVYVRQKQDYLKLSGINDVIEFGIHDCLDMQGWDIKKFLLLMSQSNPSVLEWCASNIIYLESEEMSYIKALRHEYFSIKKCSYHYYYLALRIWNRFLQNEMVSVKKYLYALSSILMIRWMNEYHIPAPIEVERLVDLYTDGSLKKDVYDLIEMKRNGISEGVLKKTSIHNYLEQSLHELKPIIDQYQDKYCSIELLEKAFLMVLEEMKSIKLFFSMSDNNKWSTFKEGYQVPDKVIAYLCAGRSKGAVAHLMQHPFKSDKSISCHRYGDEMYTWYKDTWKFVVKYGLQLPKEFIDKVMSLESDIYFQNMIHILYGDKPLLEKHKQSLGYKCFLPSHSQLKELKDF